METNQIKKEFKKYCEDNNYNCDKSDFIYDYIKYNYDLGKIKLEEIDKISDILNKELKMKEVKNDIIKKYDFLEYNIYIKDCGDSYNCYLQNKHYGIIMLMFGIAKSDSDLKQLEQMIENNLNEYIELYKEDYELNF